MADAGGQAWEGENSQRRYSVAEVSTNESMLAAIGSTSECSTGAKGGKGGGVAQYHRRYSVP
jgi:hypothetical protein